MKTLFVLLLPLGLCIADVLHVPDDYAMIQDALNAVADSDTVLVDVGVYAEALQAPAVVFALLGNVTPDTGDYPRPVIDPSSLPNPTTLACLRLPFGSHAIVKDFVFHNGPEMLPGRPFGSSGGVYSNSPTAEFHRCVFDSTFRGIYPNPGCLIQDCDFRRVSHQAINSAHVTVRGCSFSKVSGSGGSCIVLFGDSSLIEDCWFKDYIGTSLILINGSGITVRGCLFGAAPSFTNEVINGYNLRGCRIENNMFVDLQVNSAVGILQDLGNGGDTCYIRGNTYLRNVASALSGGGGPMLYGEGPAETVIFENNVFDSCVGHDLYDALELYDSLSSILVRRNRFSGGQESNAYAVATMDNRAVLRDNLFLQTGRALMAADDQPNMEARHNWWGDQSGPYHAILNQFGHGDTITGNVDFDPWHMDTLFFDGVPERPRPLPGILQLDVYPNPFNSTATLRLYVNEPGIFRVDLFNLLGQHVKEIWSGPLAQDKMILLDGSSLTSGIYFVRVWQTIGNRPVAMQKVVLLK